MERIPRSALLRGESSPFSMMRHLFDEMERALSITPFGIRSPLTAMSPFELIASGGWIPAIESFEREGKIVLRADLPGLRREDVRVEVIDDELVIAGERTHEEEESEAGSFYSERQYGCFERRIPLPEGCDPESIDATFDDGVLTISLGTAGKKHAGRSIEVKSRGEKAQAPQKGEEKQAEEKAGEVH